MRATILRVYRAYADPVSVFDGWEQRLAAVLANKPTRVIWGDRDRFIDPSFADRYPVHALHLPDDGHWHPMSNPDRVAKTLLALVAEAKSDPP